VLLILALVVSNYVILKKADFKLSPNINKIMLGNSQPECAYNDSLITDFKNLSNAGETYFYNYLKLKPLLEQNKQIDTVFIEFSTPNILKREDQKIWRSRFLIHSLPLYLSFSEIKDHKLIFTKNTAGYHQAVLKGLQNNITRIVNSNYNFKDSIGGYRYLKRQKIKQILDTLTLRTKPQFVLKQEQTSNYDLLYLEKIIQICQQKNISVILVRSPYHQKFIGNIYETSFQEMKQNRFSKIPFVDFKDFSLTDHQFGDLQHLNNFGATKFSKWFNSWLNDSSVSLE
jgi:hypothetical protein